jgi:hypothetical protein
VLLRRETHPVSICSLVDTRTYSTTAMIVRLPFRLAFDHAPDEFRGSHYAQVAHWSWKRTTSSGLAGKIPVVPVPRHQPLTARRWGRRPTSRCPFPAKRNHQKVVFPRNYALCSGPAKGTLMGCTIRWRVRISSWDFCQASH